MLIFGEVFISEIFKKPVFDIIRHEKLGLLRDLIVIRSEPLPIVDSLIISRKKKNYKIPWESISFFSKDKITSTLSKDMLAEYIESEDDLLVIRDILDKQIVDVTGAKVVRVNDIKLEGYEGVAMLVAIDAGMRGILRRLGFEKQVLEILRFLKLELSYNLISWNYIQPLEKKLKTIALTVPRQMVSELHPADIADLISSVSRQEGANLFTDLDEDTAAETLSELAPEVQASIIEGMDTGKACRIISKMPPDEAADILGDISTEKMKAILENIDKDDADDIQQLLEHEEDTAGGLMTNEYIAYQPHMTIKEAMESFKKDAAKIETIYYIYIVEENDKLKGVLSLRELLLAEPDKKLSEIMVTNLKTVKPADNESIVAAAISKYNLVAIPVVDNNGILLGIVTVDDIIDRILPPKAKRKQKKV